MDVKILKKIYLAVFIITIIGTAFPSSGTARKNTPFQLTFASHRPLDQPVAQWLFLVYEEALNRMNIKLSVEVLPSKRASKNATLGKVDGELSRVYDYNTKYPNLIRVEEHNYIVSFTAFATDPSITLNGWNSLKNTDYFFEYLSGGVKVKSKLSKIVSSDQLSNIHTLEQAVKRLLLGRTDIFITFESPMLSYLDSKEFQRLSKRFGHGKKIYSVGLMQEITGHAWLYKTHAKLAPELSVILKEMKKEGLFEIYRNQVELLPYELRW